MGRSKVGNRLNEFKYGMALYGAAWPEGDYYFVCGGGGHGLVPRIVWAQYKNGRCSDQLGEYKLGSETPMRMLMCPWGSSLLLGNANGGIRRLQIGSDDPVGHRPKLVEVSAAFREVMSGLRDEVGTMTFNSRGNLLGVGFKGSGTVKIIGYPSMKTLVEWKIESDPEVKDLDFCPIEPAMALLGHQQQQQQQYEMLATVGGDGSCQIWQVSKDQAQVLVKLEPPKGIAKEPPTNPSPRQRGAVKPRFIRCRFARNGQLLLFTLLNFGRDASYLAAYGPPAAPGQPWVMLKKVKVAVEPASAMDISKHGEWIAAGFADGALRVYNSDTLVLKAEAEASIAFVSDVTFNGDNTAVLAVGGDANCYVMELVPRQSGMGFCSWLLLLLLLLLAGAAALVLHYWQHPEALPYPALQQLSQHQQLAQACSTGGFPLHEHVCEWVQRAAGLVKDAELYGQHDEL